MIEAQTSPLGNALVGWILLSALYALVFGSPFKTNYKKDAHYFDNRVQIYFKQLAGWLHPRGGVAVTNRDLLLFTSPWANTLLFFGVFDTPVIIPRAKILSTRSTNWFFGFVPAVEVEYDNAGEREIVQLAVRDCPQLLLMLANTRSDEANEDVADDDREEAR